MPNVRNPEIKMDDWIIGFVNWGVNGLRSPAQFTCRKEEADREFILATFR